MKITVQFKFGPHKYCVVKFKDCIQILPNAITLINQVGEAEGEGGGHPRGERKQGTWWEEEEEPNEKAFNGKNERRGNWREGMPML